MNGASENFLGFMCGVSFMQRDGPRRNTAHGRRFRPPLPTRARRFRTVCTYCRFPRSRPQRVDVSPRPVIVTSGAPDLAPVNSSCRAVTFAIIPSGNCVLNLWGPASDLFVYKAHVGTHCSNPSRSSPAQLSKAPGTALSS